MLFSTHETVWLRNITNTWRIVVLVSFQLGKKLIWWIHSFLLFLSWIIELSSAVTHSLIESIRVQVSQVYNFNARFIQLLARSFLGLLHGCNKHCRGLWLHGCVDDDFEIIYKDQVFYNHFAIVRCLRVVCLLVAWVNRWNVDFCGLGALHSFLKYSLSFKRNKDITVKDTHVVDIAIVIKVKVVVKDFLKFLLVESQRQVNENSPKSNTGYYT